MASTRGRSVVIPLTNKSGGSVAAGDVVVVDTGNDSAFTTSTAGAVTGGVGIAQETIANNASGRVLVHGFAALVNTSASVTRGNYGKTHTVVKQAVDAGASRVAGVFCQFLTGGTTPTARVFSPDLGAAAGNVAADAIWDAKADLAVGTGADTAVRKAVGANGTLLMAASAQSDGLKWTGALYTCRRLITSPNTNITVDVNSTTYLEFFNTDMFSDSDIWVPTHFAISGVLASSTAGQTCTLQLTTAAAPTNPISAGGDDLVIDSTLDANNSGWIAVSDAMSGFTNYGIAIKGSNSTVDLLVRHLDIHFKIAT